jgi:uncharacterized protein YqgV (UPF0045/DUF77 family)
MYPLDKSYETAIISFIKGLRSHPLIKVETNGMSTYLFGSYDHLMKAIQIEMKQAFLSQEKIVFNLKVVNAHLQEKPSF